MRTLLYLCPFTPWAVVAKLAEVDQHGKTKLVGESQSYSSKKDAPRQKENKSDGTRRKMFEDSFLETVQSEGVAEQAKDNYKVVHRENQYKSESPTPESDMDTLERLETGG
ncbi:unnamed protein product, partial [Amoebophrya sp. A25]|eukprot:GSA25T00009539001.1